MSANNGLPDVAQTPEEFAAYFGICKSKVYHWIRTGELEATNMASGKVRKMYRILPHSIVAFVAARTAHPTSNVRRGRVRRVAAVVGPRGRK